MIRDPSSARRSYRRAQRPRGAAYSWPEVLLPWAVAESICAEAGRYLGVSIPRRRAEWLTRKAEVCFQGNERFRKKMRAPGEASIQQLRVYMRHWLASILALERPDLFKVLPSSFAMGRALPAGRAIRPPHRPGLRARRWQPVRVLAHPRWRFLAPPVVVPSYAPAQEYPIC